MIMTDTVRYIATKSAHGEPPLTAKDIRLDAGVGNDDTFDARLASSIAAAHGWISSYLNYDPFATSITDFYYRFGRQHLLSRDVDVAQDVTIAYHDTDGRLTEFAVLSDGISQDAYAATSYGDVINIDTRATIPEVWGNTPAPVQITYNQQLEPGTAEAATLAIRKRAAALFLHDSGEFPPVIEQQLRQILDPFRSFKQPGRARGT